jgi:hypothetical protein
MAFGERPGRSAARKRNPRLIEPPGLSRGREQAVSFSRLHAGARLSWAVNNYCGRLGLQAALRSAPESYVDFEAMADLTPSTFEDHGQYMPLPPYRSRTIRGTHEQSTTDYRWAAVLTPQVPGTNPYHILRLIRRPTGSVGLPGPYGYYAAEPRAGGQMAYFVVLPPGHTGANQGTTPEVHLLDDTPDLIALMREVELGALAVEGDFGGQYNLGVPRRGLERSMRDNYPNPSRVF